MRKSGFTIIEVSFVFLLILGVTFFILPMTLDNTKQARLISKWTSNYSELEYIFSVIKAQGALDLRNKLLAADNNGKRQEIVLESMKPYLRIKYGVAPSLYKQRYENDQLVTSKDMFGMDKYYATAAGEIIGLKWFTNDCSDKKTVCGIMSMDINGLTTPNKWGEDVFGINIYSDRIEPIGKNIDMETLKNDCTKYGRGIYCSYYYLIGGKFD